MACEVRLFFCFFFKLDAQMCLKSHIPLGREKKEGVNVQACRDMTLHFFPPEMSIKIDVLHVD